MIGAETIAKHPTIDVAQLPAEVWDQKSPLWWGNLWGLVIETVVFGIQSVSGPELDSLTVRRETLAFGPAQQREEATLVLACVKELPPKHQQVIYLRFYVDHSLEGIAAALGCSVGTIKSQLFRALDKLRTMKGIKAQFANLERSSPNL